MGPSFLTGCAWLLCVCDAYRILSSISDPLAPTPAVFEPYVRGQVGYYGDPANPDPERVNEGSPFSPDTPRIYLYGAPKQNCPGMVGPINDEEYYCHSRDYGYCDRRSGLCVCNQGYTGVDCTQCKPSYFMKGRLCYPKKSCPNDCSRAGVCDYETGKCTCALNRRGDDCSQVYCAFDTKCTSCTSTQCLSCIEGFYVDPTTQTCASCKKYDPRCLVCDATQCLECADLILNSIRRSGARLVDTALPTDELSREFSFKFSYGSQDPRVFDEAEAFSLLKSPVKYLNENSQRCVQGTRSDATWVCETTTVSHRVCGHPGVFSFTSPIYAVPETAQTIMLTVRRSGGGMGSATVAYELQHITTSAEDVSPTAFYTSSQLLQFADGVVELSFLLTIHDDHKVEGDETFRVILRSPTDGSSLGSQREAFVTILDDDLPLTDAKLSYIVPTSGTTLQKGGYAGDPLKFQIQAVLGNGALKTTGSDLFLMESYVADEREADLADALMSTRYRPKMLGQVVDNTNGLYTCSWQRSLAGEYTVAVYLLYPNGLQGDYFADAWLSGSPAVSRIDRQINFLWDNGPLFPGATDYVSVRWSGRLKPKMTADTTLFVDCDDHVRLWIGDLLLIDRWSLESDGGVAVQATIYLDSTILYPIIIEYRDLAGIARISVQWSTASLTKEVIPASQLYTAQHIQGSPFIKIPILPELSASPTATYLQGTFQTVAGTPLRLKLLPVDQYGNPRAAFDPAVDRYDAQLTLVTDQSLGGMGSKTVACSVSWQGVTRLFSVRCIPFFSGIHALDVQINGVKITGSPFQVTVTPNQMHPARSVLSGSGLVANRISGVATTVGLETRDLNNNRIYAASSNVRLTLRAFHTTLSGIIDLGTVVDNGDGTYTFTYTPRKVGTYLVHIKQNDVHIHNSPYSVSVVQNVPAGPTSVASGAGLSAATTFIQSTFQVQARDLNDNDVKTGGAIFKVTLDHIANGTQVIGSCVDLLSGVYTCTYTPQVVGGSRLNVGLLSGGVVAPVRDSPFSIDVIAGPALGSFSFARGTALVSSIAGERTTFTVFIRDNYGNDKLNAGTEVISVRFTGPSPATTNVLAADTGLQIKYVSNGQFEVSYRLERKGQYAIYVNVDGVAIVGSPFTMYTYPAQASYTTTSIDLVTPSTPPIRYYTGSTVVTSIASRDAFGNVLETGGNLFQFATSFKNSTLIDSSIFVDQQNGYYRFEFTPRIAQDYDLAQRLMRPGGLNGSYYGNPELQGALVLDRVDSIVDLDFGVQSPLSADQKETFSIQWRGYILPRYSEVYTFHVNVTGGARVFVKEAAVISELWPVAARSNAIGTFYLIANQLVPIEVQFSKPKSLTTANIRLSWSSLSQIKEIIPSDRLFTGWSFVNNVPPVHVDPGPPNGPSFTPEFPITTMLGTNTICATAGIAYTFQVAARDRYGNRRLGGGDSIVVIFPQLANAVSITPTVQDLGNAVYTITFTAKLSGSFTMVVAAPTAGVDASTNGGVDALVERLRPFFIQQSPFTVVVQPNQALGTTSTIIGDGFYTATAGIPAFFVVELRDLYSNLIQDRVAVSNVVIQLRQVADPSIIFIVNHGNAVDGKLQTNYTALATGMFRVMLSTFNGPFAEKTATLRVFPNLASALTSTASGTGLGPQVQASQPNSFQVDLRDFYRNPMEVGGNNLAVTLRGPGTVYADVNDLNTGQYLVQYQLLAPGTYELRTVLANPGHGLVGYYYENTRFSHVALTHAAQWVDAVMDFDWGANQTMRAYPRIQWRGYIKPQYTERYTLILQVYPLGAVYIDNSPVIDVLNTPVPGAPQVVEGSVNLVAKRLHRIVVEYRSPSKREITGHLQLQWRSASQSQQVIPTQALFPDGQELQPRYTIQGV
ncbi:hypothetical protein Poli38472_004111 [Pythium oligandrum]|uniref:PA14 domain-containing protein n=1 Tax=Pythium oligandrum TaxID=41045 RepID=A0A8K1FKR7_PYTOL|nr:hypothetical protein Poli38472_004111 [Pythium oligandrum]|eukprot:TMW66346.1 hypothetical protein Poli38472_004111 [Pythium oligandrum]